MSTDTPTLIPCGTLSESCMLRQRMQVRLLGRTSPCKIASFSLRLTTVIFWQTLYFVCGLYIARSAICSASLLVLPVFLSLLKILLSSSMLSYLGCYRRCCILHAYFYAKTRLRDTSSKTRAHKPRNSSHCNHYSSGQELYSLDKVLYCSLATKYYTLLKASHLNPSN